MKDKLFKIINYVVLFIFTWIFINSFFRESSTFYHINPWISLISSIVMLGAWYFIYKLINKAKKITMKKEIIFLIIFFMIFIGIQILIINNFKVKPGWDFGVIFENAKNYAIYGNRHYTDYYYSYFSWYPNNIMLFSIFCVIIKLGHIVGIAPFDSCIISNVLCINIAIFILYLLIRKKFDNKKAMFAMIISLCFLPFYLYSPIFYSDTFSLPFIVLLLYLFTFIPNDFKCDRKNIILLILIGIITFVGKEIKMTVIFVLLAILINRFLNTKVKSFCKQVGIILLPIIILTVIYNVLVVNNKTLDFKADNEWGSFPKTTWVMMGIEDPDGDYTGHNSYGGYKGEDYDATKAQPTRKKAIKYNIDEYFRRVEGYGIFGYANYLTNKAVNAWTEGLYYSNIKLSFYPENPDNPNRKYIDSAHDEFKYIEYFAQAWQISFIILIILSCIYNIKKKEYTDEDMIVKLSTLMLLLFLLLWENRSRYLFHFVPIFIYIMVECYYKVLNSCKKTKE